MISNQLYVVFKRFPCSHTFRAIDWSQLLKRSLVEMFPQSLILLAVLFGSCQAAWNVTCDFDLDNIENIISYLPLECQEIYKSGSTSELYEASLAESKKFQEFYDGLEAYEQKSTRVGEEKPEKNMTLRFEIYNAVMLTECAENITSRTDSLADKEKTKEFYECLLTKREEMFKLIPK